MMKIPELLPDRPAPLVSLENAGLNRNGRWLVRGIDLTVHSGEVVTLIGPNGAGKSTTAKIALGLEPMAKSGAMIQETREISAMLQGLIRSIEHRRPFKS